MAAKGLYRTRTAEGGAEYAYVDYGSQRHGGVPRVIYEHKGYEPPFYDLPTKEEYEAGNAQRS
jgi:hypothetical protein